MTYTISSRNPWITLNDDKVFQRVAFACDVYKDQAVIAGGYYCGTDTRDGSFLTSAVMYHIKNKTQIDLPDIPLVDRCFGAILKDIFYVSNSVELKRICLSSQSEWEDIDLAGKMLYKIIANSDDLFLFSRDRNWFHYDTITKDIVNMPPMPTLLYGFATAVVGNRIFVVGGFYESDQYCSSTLYVFEISTQSWSQASPLPKRLRYPTAITICDRWIIVSGECDEYVDIDTQTLVFDTFKQQWSESKVKLSEVYADREYAVLNGIQVIAIGGEYGENQKYPMQAIHAKYLVPGYGWEMIKDCILLRRLIEKSRARPFITNKKMKFDADIDTNTDKVLQKLFTDMSSDIFRLVLSFLL